ncbi:MAG: hypothetical protein ABSD08_11050 [Xanthobacteraceae bacterium]
MNGKTAIEGKADKIAFFEDLSLTQSRRRFLAAAQFDVTADYD